MADLIEFGKIVNTHGLKGEVKVYSYTDNEANILKLKKVYIDGTKYDVQSIKPFKNMFIMKLKGIDVIEDTKILIDKMCFREIVQGESNDEEGYFVKDLVGIHVVDEDNRTIGTLKEVFNTGANDVYEVVLEDGKSIYLPAIKQVVKKIDIDSKTMVVQIMEGLI
ncbi:MAG: 16S rRNA processing protein RimM [Clostridia bacterium]|nr:16S rRNA processing protein RimM [Clostridia bacterium]